MDTVLKLNNVEKYYGNNSNITKAIDRISFEVDKGEFVVLWVPVVQEKRPC